MVEVVATALASLTHYIIAGGQATAAAAELEVKHAAALLPLLPHMAACQQVAKSQQSEK